MALARHARPVSGAVLHRATADERASLSGKAIRMLAVSIAMSAIAVCRPPLVDAQTRTPAAMGIDLALGGGWNAGGLYAHHSAPDLHAAATLRAWPLPFQNIVLGFTADLFFHGSGDDCVLRYPGGSGCLPEFPNLTALTLGWRSTVLNEPDVTLHVALGRFSGRKSSTGGTLARLQFAPRSTHVAVLFFTQYEFLPSFRGSPVSVFLTGMGFQVH
jgi:hypothetical protein